MFAHTTLQSLGSNGGVVKANQVALIAKNCTFSGNSALENGAVISGWFFVLFGCFFHVSKNSCRAASYSIQLLV